MWDKIYHWIDRWVFVIICIFVGWGVFIYEPKNQGLPPSAGGNNLKAPLVFSQPEKPLPKTGYSTATFSNGVAPLNIKTSSSGAYHYFVKIVNTKSHEELGSYFIRSGEALDIEVPLGSYEVRYATGRRWYGKTYLFGPDTMYSKADSLFTFSFDGQQYSGYTVELIMQKNGNLKTSGIQPDQW